MSEAAKFAAEAKSFILKKSIIENKETLIEENRFAMSFGKTDND